MQTELNLRDFLLVIIWVSHAKVFRSELYSVITKLIQLFQNSHIHDFNMTHSEIDYGYYILVRDDGIHWPIIRVHSFGTCRLIELLGTDEMLNIKVVNDVIKKLHDHKKNSKNTVSYIYSKTYIIELNNENATLSIESAEDEHIVIEIDFLIRILTGWSFFIKRYECKEIPGIVYH